MSAASTFPGNPAAAAADALASWLPGTHRGVRPGRARRHTMDSPEANLAQESLQDWREWFDEHGHKLLLFARQQTRCRADAEDVLQSAIVRVWQGRGRRGQDRTFAPTLAEVYTAIRRAAIDLGRKNSRRTRREQSVVANATDFGICAFESNLDDEALQTVLAEAIAELPEKFRVVLTLKIWSEQTFAEIAESLDIPLNTAASRYRYALGHLRRKLSACRADLLDHLG